MNLWKIILLQLVLQQVATTIYVADQIIPNEETDKSLLLTTNDAATFVAKAPANKVYFYAVTEKLQM